MQNSANPDKITLYNRLAQYYILIFIQDIEQFYLKDLQGLAFRLEAKLQLDQKQKQINQKLTTTSEQNIKKKKMNKKKKNGSMMNSFSQNKTLDQSINSYFPIEESFNIEESIVYLNGILSETYVQKSKFPGVIYDGNLTITLPLKYKGQLSENILFEIKVQQKKSYLSVTTLKKLKIQKEDNITLDVAQRQHSFYVNGQSNILGLDFLNNHKVILQCNFRPQINKFTLAFTS